MQKQLKGLLTLIVMMLSISYLHAQCPGNKVQMFKPTHAGCLSKCVPSNKVDHYVSQGWLIFCPNSGGGGFLSLDEDTAISSAPCLKVTVQRPDNSFFPNVPVTIKNEAGTPVKNGNAVEPGIYFLRMDTASESKVISLSAVK